MTSFAELALIPPLQQAVRDCGYASPTPIQAQAIPPLLAGRDVLGCAQTGTGKTAAFSLPALQHLAELERGGHRQIRVLVLSPTRELAAQIGACFEDYSVHLNCRHLVIHGGVNQNPQVRALRRGVDVLVATPGRLLDLLDQGEVHLGHVSFLVLDEADRMLDMGFVRDVERVLKRLPRRRQSALFSATLPDSIIQLSRKYLQDPVEVSVAPEEPTLDAITQVLYYLERPDKKRLLAELLQDPEVDRAIVFVRTKHGANRLVKQLERAGIEARAIHGNKSQGARTRALAGFRDGSVPVLVATDVASRGIDVDGVSHVIQVDLPNEPEVYVHRIGRTGRAGRDGVAICFCDSTETDQLRQIERLTGRPIRPVVDHPWHSDQAMEQRDAADRRSSRGRSRHGGGSHASGGGQPSGKPRRRRRPRRRR